MPAPGKPGPLIKRIERTVMEAHLLAQVRKANLQEQIELEDVKDTLAANAWFAAGNGKYESKNSFKKTTERDSTERSLGFKLLLGNVPVMKRQVAWYPLAYPEPEMLRCPRDHPEEAPEETREHFLECTWEGPELPPPQPGSAVAAWMDMYIRQTIPMVGISQRDRRNALDALRQDIHPHQRTVREPTATMVRTVLQGAYRKRLAYVRDRWIARNERQIEREEMSGIRPGRRRQLMKKEQTRILGITDGVPRWPRTKIDEAGLQKTAIAVYNKLAGLRAS
ncbi:hypothetical protein GGI22_002417 [Coemansia erecta]|nr:hypothetical protein GGI22_002417 [Coemansia erecta]